MEARTALLPLAIEGAFEDWDSIWHIGRNDLGNLLSGIKKMFEMVVQGGSRSSSSGLPHFLPS